MNNKVSLIKRRRFLIGARTVSIGMEPYLWDCLRDISEREDMDIPAILAGVNQHFHEPRLSDKTRSFIWQYYRRAACAAPQSCGYLECALESALPLLNALGRQAASDKIVLPAFGGAITRTARRNPHPETFSRLYRVLVVTPNQAFGLQICAWPRHYWKPRVTPSNTDNLRIDSHAHSPAPGIEARKGRDAIGGSVHESPAGGAKRRTGAPESWQGEAIVERKSTTFSKDRCLFSARPEHPVN